MSMLFIKLWLNSIKQYKNQQEIQNFINSFGGKNNLWWLYTTTNTQLN